MNIGLELEQEWKNYDEIIYQQEDYFKDSKYLDNKLNENFDKLEYVVLYGLINDDFDIKAYLNKNIKDSVAEYSLLIDEKEYNQDILEQAIVYDDIYKQPNRKKCALLPWWGFEKILNKIEK